MKFYTIYLSCRHDVFNLIKDEINGLTNNIIVTESAYVKMVARQNVSANPILIDAPLDTTGLYVYINEKELSPIEESYKNIHEFLISEMHYFVSCINHKNDTFSLKEIRYVAQQLIQIVEMLNNGQWDGGEINVQ